MGRQQIFDDIAAALRDVTETDPATDTPIPWEYGQPTAIDDVLELFIDRVIDYKALVGKAADESEIPALVARFLGETGATSCVVPPGIDVAWYSAAEAAGVKVLRDDPPLSKEELDRCNAVLTAACAGMAETGTIVLDHGPDQGRRIISLLPDTHVCVIRSDQIVTDVPEAMARIAPTIRGASPMTWISGPSATSDIELNRVEGVHGPRNLCVIIVD